MPFVFFVFLIVFVLDLVEKSKMESNHRENIQYQEQLKKKEENEKRILEKKPRIPLTAENWLINEEVLKYQSCLKSNFLNEDYQSLNNQKEEILKQYNIQENLLVNAKKELDTIYTTNTNKLNLLKQTNKIQNEINNLDIRLNHINYKLNNIQNPQVKFVIPCSNIEAYNSFIKALNDIENCNYISGGIKRNRITYGENEYESIDFKTIHPCESIRKKDLLLVDSSVEPYGLIVEFNRLYIYPDFIMVFNNSGLVGIYKKEAISLTMKLTNKRIHSYDQSYLDSTTFTEKEPYQVWEHANMDGSRDHRFKYNKLLTYYNTLIYRVDCTMDINICGIRIHLCFSNEEKGKSLILAHEHWLNNK